VHSRSWLQQVPFPGLQSSSLRCWWCFQHSCQGAAVGCCHGLMMHAMVLR
jgi:hypothetical protein